LGVVAATVAFVSLVLPWWEVSVTYDGGFSVSHYLWGYQLEGKFFLWEPLAGGIDVETLLFGPMPCLAFALMVTCGTVQVIASIIAKGNQKLMLGLAGIFSMLSIIFFAVWELHGVLEVTSLGSYLSISLNPSFGFGSGIIASVLTVVAYIKYPKGK